MNEMDKYQLEVARTAAPNPGPVGIAVLALGVAGEAGEVADYVKKHLGHGHPLDREAVIKELGDVAWYVAALAAAVGSSLREVTELNTAKLRKRYPDGFSTQASLQRVDTEGEP